MLFNSTEFLFIYLPIVFLGFFLIGRSSHYLAALWLAAASVFFYGWWNPAFVQLLLISIAFNYSAAYGIGHAQNTPWAKFLLITTILIDLALLGVYKYTNFFISTVNLIASVSLSPVDIILPLGISFFTFTQIAFLVDVYRGIAREYNFVHYMLFVSYFPHLIAGPILHHKQMMPQFEAREIYRPSMDNVAVGLTIFTIGLAKKIMLADNFGGYASPVFDSAQNGMQPSLFVAWTGALAYTLQLYFDFSGYSDMAIGISRLFGIRLPLNFNSPYKAPNIIEFWRRWHMTLSLFLRDYLYVTLGGNRHGEVRRYVNLMVTMLLGGLWHGANWTFVAWGGIHGLYLMINHVWCTSQQRLGTTGNPFLIKYMLNVGLTFLAVVIAWVLFRAESFTGALSILKGMVGANGCSLSASLASSLGSYSKWLENYGIKFNGFFADLPTLGTPAWFFLWLSIGLGIVWFAPNTQELLSRYHPAWDHVEEKIFFVWKPSVLLGLIFGILFTLCVMQFNRSTQFLYFQF